MKPNEEDKKNGLPAALFGGILGGCAAASGPPGDEPFSADDAIAKVIRQEQRIHFPETEGKIEGIIHGAVRIRECASPVRSRPPRKNEAARSTSSC
ncbi:hypothetical protein VQ056_10715 [Paenibacillus sp. JTLBN-2024]